MQFFFYLCLTLIVTQRITASCVTLPPTSVCYSVLNYNPFIPTYSCVALQELSIETRPYAAMSNACRAAVSAYACASTYPPCTNITTTTTPNLPLRPPLLSCSNVVTSCASHTDRLAMQLSLGTSPLSCYDTNSTWSTWIHSPVLPVYPTCQPYTGAVCRGVVTYSVYASTSASLLAQERDIERAVGIFAVMPLVFGIRDNVVAIMCYQAFPRCATDIVSPSLSLAVPLSVPVPQFASQDQCNAVAAFDAELFSTFLRCDAVVNVTNCDNTRVLEAVPLFVPGTTFNMSGFQRYSVSQLINIPTNVYNLSTIQVHPICPYPLVLPDSDAYILSGQGVNGGSCQIPCQALLFPNSAWSKAWSMSETLMPISFAATLFLTITWGAFYDELRWKPAHWVAIMMCGAMLASMVSLYSSPGPTPICKSNVQIRDDMTCHVSAVFLDFFFLAAESWVLMLVMDVALLVYADSGMWHPLTRARKRRIYHVFVWSVSLMVAVDRLVLSLDGAGSAFPVCLNLQTAYTSNWWFITLVSQGIQWLYILGCAAIVARLVFRRRMSNTSTVWRELQTHRRLLLFLCVMLLSTGFASYSVFGGATQSDIVISQTAAWIACAIASYPTPCDAPSFYLSPSIWLVEIACTFMSMTWFSIVYFKLDYVTIYYRWLRGQPLRGSATTSSAAASSSSTSSAHMHSRARTATSLTNNNNHNHKNKNKARVSDTPVPINLDNNII